MRSLSVALVASAFAVACADSPSAPLLQPDGASFTLGKAPPPWALIEGELTTDGGGEVAAAGALSSRSGGGGEVSFSHSTGGNTATYRAWLMVTPGGKSLLLRFTDGGTATFSTGAMIMKVNGKVTGKGTMIVGGHTYDLGAVTNFTADGECATTPYDEGGPPCASFSAGDGSFSSQESVWTGVVSSDGTGSGSVGSCTPNADYVVANLAQLSAALAAVSAGGTIAINGLIEVPGSVSVQADDIRLTCATSGSGLITSSGSTPFALLEIGGDGVQVDNLFLSSVPADGVGGASHAVFAVTFPGPVEGLRLSFNRIRCGNSGTCAFLVGAPGAVVSDNTVQSLGTTSGLHFQANGPVRTDNTIVERNLIVAPTISGSPLFGAVRVRDGEQQVVRHNATWGVWRNGIALAELDGALIENNSIRGAQDHGIIGSTNSPSAISVRNSTIRANSIDGPQAIGINLTRACWNRLESNSVTGAPGTLRARFEVNTGANVWVGSSAGVLDQGNFDCDGDDNTDPNRVGGQAGASSSQASAARIAAGPLQSRSASQSGSGSYPELQ